MKYLLAGPLLWLCLVPLIGCKSEEPFVNNSVDPVSFAKDVKTVVLNHAELAKKSPEPADSIGLIVETVSSLDNSPTGEHLSTYEKIHASASELLAECSKANGKPPGLDAKLDELINLAKTLPGDVTVENRPRD